jgi:hypothetical protein
MTTEKENHFAWVCPDCKKNYDADDWVEIVKESLIKEERKRILEIIDKWIKNNKKINVDINKVENNVLED